ncbi:glutamate--tRNA ligase [Rhodocaloribacter litoris]|uniref:glutamate--tRNA ligase n=1 Tax=Rhodocaloribacter litoris TaxID=2558931 RepID=UPI001421393B|nr:glutamate--tRNA ligase [Rhodocaloribacter litoris]QXD15310.1 glutamate--tRNA ligase [Rhodocaloribacter litoris]
MAETVRVRFAPSPTGLLHIGGLRTALYNYLFARRHGGAFLLRIEDTDRTRFVPEAEDDILASLRWAGLEIDEGPEQGGPHAPYRQSQRQAIYREHVQRLLEAGHAYVAFDTPEELEQMRTRLATEDDPSPKYDARTRQHMTNSLTLPAEEVARRLATGEPHVVRLKVEPGETIRFHDLIRGEVAIETDQVDDQVLLKSDGLPTYHLANVVDDHLMGITHVIRGEEWLPSTPKHLLLYRAFGWEPPRMAHLPLILSPNGGKLSKRNAEQAGIPVSVRQYREAGYEPEALVNFLAFLGWNPGDEREILSLQELIEAFSLDRVGSAGVQFNLDKLQWYNEQYLRRMPLDRLVERARPHVERAGYTADDAYLRRVAALMQERIRFAHELATACPYFFEDPVTYDEAGVRKRWKDDAPGLVSAYADRLEALDRFDAATAEAALRALAEARGVGAGRIIHPTRLALSGVTFGPGLFEMMEVLGRETCLRRLRRAVAVLGDGR